MITIRRKKGASPGNQSGGFGGFLSRASTFFDVLQKSVVTISAAVVAIAAVIAWLIFNYFQPKPDLHVLDAGQNRSSSKRGI